MKLTFKIAKLELRNLFYSPVAWFLAIVFLVIAGTYYTSILVHLANNQDSLIKTTPSFNGFNFPLTREIFMSMNKDGFMGNIFNNLYLFIPLLTMGLMNKEFNSGTIRLLYSSPVKTGSIIAGKYLAIMVYNLMLLAMVVIIMTTASFSIKDIDVGYLLCGVIAFYLVICAYTAIGLFMSSITNYNIVAAIGTFIILFALEKIGGMWQDYDFFRDLTYFMSISGRAEQMIDGLITSRDVMYYVLITLMFLLFTYLSLRHGREMVSKFTKVRRYVAVVLFVLTAGYLTSRPGYIAYWDGTRTQKNTIMEPTQAILANMQDAPLKVTLYSNLLDNGFANTRPSARNAYVWKLWDRFVRFKPDIQFNYVHFYDVKQGDSTIFKFMPGKSLDSIAILAAKMHKANINDYLVPAEIKKMIDLEPEDMRPLMLLEYKGKRIFLRTYKDNYGLAFWPREANFAAAFKRLSTDYVPKVYFSTGHWERSITKLGEREYAGFSTFKDSKFSLINNGFELDTLNLNFQEIPSDASALVLADPKTDLPELVLRKINTYISEGGNVLFNGEPGKQHILNPILKQIGTALMPGMLINISKNETPDKTFPYRSMDYTRLKGEGLLHVEVARKNLEQGDSSTVPLFGSTSVSYVDSGYNINKLLISRPPGHIWSKLGNVVLDSAAPVMDVTMGDYKLEAFNQVIALDRKIESKEQKIIVSGDADYASNILLQASNIMDYPAWMADGSYPIILISKEDIDKLLTINLASAKTQKLMFVWVLPTAILCFGIVVLYRRKRQ